MANKLLALLDDRVVGVGERAEGAVVVDHVEVDEDQPQGCLSSPCIGTPGNALRLAVDEHLHGVMAMLVWSLRTHFASHDCSLCRYAPWVIPERLMVATPLARRQLNVLRTGNVLSGAAGAHRIRECPSARCSVNSS